MKASVDSKNTLFGHYPRWKTRSDLNLESEKEKYAREIVFFDFNAENNNCITS